MALLMVMDGQGGGIGSAIIKKLRDAYAENIEILALGTNSVATSQMMKAGANRGATGENAIMKMASEVDVPAQLSVVLHHRVDGEARVF